MHRALLAAFVLALFAHSAGSQLPVPATPQTQTQQLQALRDKNAQLLDRQTAILQRIQELKETALSIKILGRRT